MSDQRTAAIDAHFQRTLRTVELTKAQGASDILQAAGILTRCFKDGGKLLICGNGGSAADAQHMAAEFVSRLRRDRPRQALPAVALTTDTSFITAYANDAEFSGIFARQVEALGKKGDVLLGISTSGSSANVLQACEAAKEKGMHVLALTGPKGMACDADCTVAVDGEDTQCIQEVHLIIEHLLCELVEDALFPVRS